jgi:hypothetical protein
MYGIMYGLFVRWGLLIRGLLIIGAGECEINEQMEWCPEGDTHGVSELISHSH